MNNNNKNETIEWKISAQNKIRLQHVHVKPMQSLQ